MTSRFILFLLLLILSTSSLFAQTAIAPANGDGSSGDPYEIATWQNLYWISQNSNQWDKYYIQTADIDFADASPAINTWNGGEGWEPIGDSGNEFEGSIDGNGHTITGLFINRPGGAVAGLFGSTHSGSEITNLGLEEVNITAGTHVGGLVGLNHGMITSSYTTGRVSGSNLQIGGLVGTNFGTITESFSICSVVGVTGSGRVGGLVGSNDNTITNSYATGDVTGSSGIGGLVGRNGDKINNSYATGKVNGSNRGGLVGDGPFGTITTSYWNTETSGTTTGIGNGSSSGVTGLTSAEVRQQAPFTGFDFTGTWQIEEGIAFPVLRNNTPDSAPGFIFEEGDGNEATPYEVGTVAQLNAIRYNLDAHYILTADIDLTNATGESSGDYWNDGEGWEPIGTNGNQFTGTYDGDGHTITGLFIKRPDQDDIGFFGETSNSAEVKSLGLLDVSIEGGVNRVGGLVGANRGDIVNSYTTGSVKGDGGLTGVNTGTISNSYSTVNVSGSGNTGGLVGNNAGTVTTSYATGSVSGSFQVGGLVGINFTAGSITTSYATGNVNGNSQVGGLVGNNAGTVTTSYWNTETSGQSSSAGGTGLTSEQMRQEAIYIGFDFDNEWQIESGTYSSYPYLREITYDEPGTEPEVNPIPGLFTFSPDENNILFVDQNVSGGNGGGNSWANAVPELRDALVWAQNWDADADGTLQIWVADGTYLPTDDDREVSFQMINYVEIYGGFAGSEDPDGFDLADRDFETNETVLSGDIGVAEDDSDNAYHVFSHNDIGLDETAVLDGVTISEGRATGLGTNLFGAGMFNINSSPTLKNVVIKHNSSHHDDNTTYGGGMYNDNSDPVLENVIFSGNEAQYGGGMVNRSGSDPTLTNVTFQANEATFGGGIYNHTSSPAFINVLISGNDAVQRAGGIQNYNSNPTLTNVTISGNSKGGMANIGGSYPILKNSIAWGNAEADVQDLSGGPYGTNSTTIERSIVGGVDDPENGNIDEDPVFVNSVSHTSAPTTAGDYRLQRSSPAINASDNNALPGSITTDREGNPRFDADIADMGAYEFQGASLPAVTTDTEINTITSSSADLAGEVTNDGTIEITGRGFAWSLEEDPDITANVVTSGAGMGVFNETLTDLPPGSQIYVRAYVTNNVGTAYGQQVSFNTEQAELTISGSFNASNKVYDGDAEASFDENNLSLTGIFGDHEVSLHNLALSFAQADAGTNLVVSLTNAELTGEDAGKYTLSLDGVPTANADITPKTLEVVADAQNKVYGVDDPELTYTADGFELSDDTTILTGTLSREAGEDVGTYAIGQGDLSAGGNYTISFTGADLTIGGGTLTIKADELSKTYGEADPELTYSVSGFIDGDDESILTGSLEREEGEAVGTYDIEQGDLDAGDNYTIDFTESELTIEGRVLTITADELSKTYGEADPELTYSVSGFAGGDDESILTGNLVREEGEAVGAYTITQGNLSAGDNYTIDFNEAEFIIEGGVLTITADDQVKIYGEADPELTYSVSGFASGEDESILTGNLAREEGEAVGAYTIAQGDLSAGENYAINFSGAEFNIEGKILTIATKNQTKVYGEADPELTYSVSGFAGGDDESVITGSLLREEGEDAGSYEIQRGDLSAGENYTISFKPGELSIGLKRLKVTADEGLTKIAGQADPVLTFTATGFAFEEDESVLSGSLRRGGGEAPGEYAIRLGDLSAGNNYVINFTGDVFRILHTPPLAVNITPGEASKNIPLDTQIYLEFDQVIQITNPEGIRLENDGEALQNITSVIEENQQLVITHNGLEHLSEYEVVVESGAISNHDGVGNEGISWTFTTIVQAPEKVTLLSPADSLGSVSAQNILLEWEEEANAGSYQLTLAEDEGFESIITEEQGLEQTSFSYDELEYGTVYYWRVRAVNENSTGLWSDTAVFVTQLQQPLLAFPFNDADEISIAPVLEWDSDYEEVMHHVELSESPDFEDIAGIENVPADFSEISGLQADQTYYWRVRTVYSLMGIQTGSSWSEVSSFTTRQDPSQAETGAVSVSFEFGNSSDPQFDGDPSQQDYRMLGLPGSDGLKVDQIFNGPYTESWKAFYDSGSEVDFLVEYTPDDARFSFDAGSGFWVLSTEPVALNQVLTAVEIDEKDRFGIEVHPGWNIIANPFQKTISWEAVQVANQITADLYSFNGQYGLSDNLEAFTGYYFYNDPAWDLQTLHIPYSDMEQQNPKQLKKAVSEESSFLALEIDFTHGSTSSVELQQQASTPEADEFSKPHPGLEYARLGMVVADAASPRNSYRRALVDDSRPKLLQIKAPSGTYGTWNFEGSGDALLAVNKATNKTVLIESGQSEEVQFTEPLSTYEVYVGDVNTLMELQTDLLPQAFELSQNYPNPFNPTTNIRYSVPERTNVTLEIFDLLGRKVQTLVNEQQSAGWHVINWDASTLASGMYLYRLRAGDQVFTKKLTLIK